MYTHMYFYGRARIYKQNVMQKYMNDGSVLKAFSWTVCGFHFLLDNLFDLKFDVISLPYVMNTYTKRFHILQSSMFVVSYPHVDYMYTHVPTQEVITPK